LQKLIFIFILRQIFGLKAVEIYRTSAASGGAPVQSSKSFVLLSVLPQELCQGIVHRWANNNKPVWQQTSATQVCCLFVFLLPY